MSGPSRWLAFVLIPMAQAGELSQQTLRAWDGYVRTASACMKDGLHSGHPFLWIDSHPELAGQVRAGRIVIAPMTDPSPKRVPSGLIHHWIGAVFVPNAKMADVLDVVRDYDHYKKIFPSAVLESKAIRQDGEDDEFSMLLVSRATLARTALASVDQSSYHQLDPWHWYSISYTTRVQEVENYGEPGQYMLPPDQGHGYIWRLFGINRFEERDGGVYLETEAIALSRDIPSAVRWIVDPIVRRLAKDSLETTLRRTEQAVANTACHAAADRTAGQQP